MKCFFRCMLGCGIAVGAIAAGGSELKRAELLSARHRMVDQLREDEGFGDAQVLEAMRLVPRHEFVPKRLRSLAYYDMALPIGRGQTISPPSMVARMIDRLDAQPGDRVLEVGTGTGYQAAVLSQLAAEVWTIEIVGSLARKARSTLKRVGCDNVQVRTGDGYLGWPEQAPFDGIIVACSPEKVPAPLVAQLREGGKMVVPLGAGYDQMLYLLTKTNGVLRREAVAPTVFVPMTGRAGSDREDQANLLAPTLINGSFEELISGSERVRGWYHQRQLTVLNATDAPDGDRFVMFENEVPGRTAEASQAFGLAGRRVEAVKLSGMVKGEAIEPGPGQHERASVVLAFYDANRELIRIAETGEWVGTFDWRPFEKELSVPRGTREAIVRIGLCGARGRLSMDKIELTAIR